MNMKCAWCGKVPIWERKTCNHCGFELVKPEDFDFGLHLTSVDANSIAGKFIQLCANAVKGNEVAIHTLVHGEDSLSNSSKWSKCDNAVNILNEAAKRGFKWAMYCLGRMYFKGCQGLPKDYEKAKKLIESAANADPAYCSLAIRHICMCYFDGVGGYPLDVKIALKYFDRLVRRNYKLAVETLALMFNRTNLPGSGEAWASKETGDNKVYSGEGVPRWPQEWEENPYFSYANQLNKQRFSDAVKEVESLLDGRFYACEDCKDRYWRSYKISGLDMISMFYRENESTRESDWKKDKAIDYILYLDFADFAKRIGKSGAQFLSLLREYILTNRRAGVRLWDGSIQSSLLAKEKFGLKDVVNKRDREREKVQKEAMARLKKEKQAEKAEESKNNAIGCGCLCVIIALIALIVFGPDVISNNPIGEFLGKIREWSWLSVVCCWKIFAGIIGFAWEHWIISLIVIVLIVVKCKH